MLASINRRGRGGTIEDSYPLEMVDKPCLITLTKRSCVLLPGYALWPDDVIYSTNS